jgi:predicted nucleic acid-binding protein
VTWPDALPIEALDDAIDSMGLTLQEVPRAALFLAGKAFLLYRRRGGGKSNVLADFFVGAHAAVMGCGMLTRDPRRYNSYFPRVALIVPDSE